jgi:hypothetical protein
MDAASEPTRMPFIFEEKGRRVVANDRVERRFGGAMLFAADY